jgi:ABC-type proline/glycine betaine transport system permease subunit
VIGIALGLWAARDERIAPIILYTVGIIQTIPSLALFGLLLVPLSNLGGELLTDMLLLLLAATAITVVLGGATVLFGSRWPEWRTAQVGMTIISALAATIPLALATLIVVSLLFRVGFQAAITDEYLAAKLVFAGALALNAVLLIAGRVMRMRDRTRDRLRRIRRGLSVVALLGLLAVLFQSGADFLPDTPIGGWSLRDVGIRGIGVTPTLVALTLYSLLPLVRNTYAGLNNVDAAIIDSGKGMGMTPRQIFFQIELPLAFPVIMAGVRNAAIALIGIATIATVVGGGGLGDYVIDGITNVSLDKILLGTIPAILLAFAVDIGLRVIETTLTSPGIRYVANQ